MPAPRALDDGGQVFELWLPTQFTLDFLRGGDESRRITGPARLFHNRDFLSGYIPTNLDHFAHARTAAGAEIVRSAGRSLEREDVSVGQIDNVDVIANAGAVGRFVIRPENFEMRFLSQRDLEHIWNQMRFEAVIFAELF